MPDTAQIVLVNEDFETLSALLCASDSGIHSLDIKIDLKALFRETLKQLQFKLGKGPLNSSSFL